MRLRYLAVEYFHEASRSSREEYLRHALPLPTVSSLKEEELDAFSKSDGVAYICHRSLFDSSSPKISLELARDFPWFEETNIYDKFLSEIFPPQLPRQPSIHLGDGVITGSELVLWLCSDMEQIKLQVRKEDDNRISSGSQIADSSEIRREVTPESIISDKVPHDPSGSGQSTFGQHVKEQKPGSFVSEFLSIEPPQLELKDYIPQPDCWRTIILGLGGAQLTAVEQNEGLALPKVNVPKDWFDILPLPCSLERWKNESTKAEARFNDVHELRRIDDACRSWRYPHEINELVAKIMPMETRMIPENLNWKNRGEKEMTYPLKPTRLLQRFESHEGKMERDAHNFPVGGFNIKVTLEESLTSKLSVYHEEYTQPPMLPPGLLCDHCGPQPYPVQSVMDSATHGTKLTFEIPRTCDWRLKSLANTTPGIIIAHDSEILAPDLPRLQPLQSFESAVVIPELSLDDQQFQFLPVPMVTSCPQEQMIDHAELGRFVSLNCEPCTLPATDWLYLDWHFFHGLKCTDAACFSLHAQLIKEAQCQPLPSISLTRPVVASQKGSKFAVELRLLENTDFHQDSSAISHVTGTPGKKIEALLCSQTRGKQSYQSPVEIQRPSEMEHKSLGHSQDKSQEGQPSNDPVRRRDVRSSSVQTDSEFMVNDIDFFVRARKGIPGPGSDQIIEDPQRNSSNVVNKQTLSMTPGPDDQDHPTEAAAFCEHQVEISKEIRKCMISLSSDYFALLAIEEISELTTPGELKTLQQFGFDADGNSYLTSLISNMADEPVSRQRQMVLRGLITLHVLRQTALNLCSYGIQVGHLYLENCFEKMQFLEGHIMSSRTELEEAYDHVERGMVEDHPKLSHLDKLLGPAALEIHRSKYLSTRILLLADRRAFFTLVKKLVSLGLTPYQIDRKENYLRNGALREDSLDKLKDEISEALTFSDCLLVSYAYVNPSFPVQCFTMIIQYADSPQTRAMISSWTTGGYVVHFFKILVHAEERKSSSSASQRQSVCQDPQEHNICGSTSLFKPNIALTHSADQSLSESSTLNQNIPPSEHERTTHSQSGGATEQIIEESCSSNRREMIIVANISHPNDHILTGRRSSYQKILHLEKENLQVVERELRLPVDLILSPASCIVVYTLEKLNLEPQNLKEKQETVQNEVLTHLKAISFSFRDCIMIFEGPTEFTTAALEISTQIYTLAIALDIQFQCFASRHPDVTDIILMHTIQAVRRSKHMPSYPIMTEGPTLAEVFLTGFPSINPLTAHAILSSGCPLPLFMSYAPEQQYAAVEPYEVPKHCLELFKAQCTFKAIGITEVSDCKGVEEQTNQPDVGISYQHQAASPVVCVDVPNQASGPEVWTSFPEFPPASAVSEDSPTYNVRDMNPINSFPEFPPASAVNEDSPAYNVRNMNPINSFPEFPPASAVNEDSPTYNVRDMNPINSFPDFPPISEICPFQLEKRHCPWVTSASVKGSKRLGGGHEILQDSDEPIRRSQLGVKRCASSFSFISPMVHPQDMDGFFKLPPGPNGIDEFPSICLDWIENSPPVREETNVNSGLRQSKRPRATLKISSSDRFRYQSRTPAPTVSNSYTQTTIKFPAVKLPRAAPRSRTQAPSVTYLPPTIAGKPTSAKKTFSEVAADRRPRAILGVTRRGSDTQQRLVWKTDPSSSSLKRQRKS